MTDEQQELVDDLADLAQVLKVLGKNADSLTCTRAAIWIAGTSPRPEETVREAAIEECALVCESRAGSQAMAAFRILMSAAEAIRALKSSPQPQSSEDKRGNE